MGLSAKNAILIVEFAVDAQKRGDGSATPRWKARGSGFGRS